MSVIGGKMGSLATGESPTMKINIPYTFERETLSGIIHTAVDCEGTFQNGFLTGFTTNPKVTGISREEENEIFELLMQAYADDYQESED